MKPVVPLIVLSAANIHALVQLEDDRRGSDALPIALRALDGPIDILSREQSTKITGAVYRPGSWIWNAAFIADSRLRDNLSATRSKPSKGVPSRNWTTRVQHSLAQQALLTPNQRLHNAHVLRTLISR